MEHVHATPLISVLNKICANPLKMYVFSGISIEHTRYNIEFFESSMKLNMLYDDKCYDRYACTMIHSLHSHHFYTIKNIPPIKLKMFRVV